MFQQARKLKEAGLPSDDASGTCSHMMPDDASGPCSPKMLWTMQLHGMHGQVGVFPVARLSLACT